MMESLPLKYRPKTLDEMVGNEALIASLKSMLEREPKARPHTYLLQGPSGCGKTTLARIIGRMLDCSPSEFHEYNISHMGGKDVARAIIEKGKYPPLDGKVKVFVLNECHRATKDFQDAMLETLEEPPEHVYYILCTTEPEKLLNTIQGQRGAVLQVSKLPSPKIISLLKQVMKKELEGDLLPDRHLKQIARVADGSPRKALRILDQIIDIEDDDLAYEAILEASIESTSIKEMIQILLDGQTKKRSRMAVCLKAFDGDIEGARKAVKSYFRSILLDSPYREEIYKVMRAFLEPFHYSGLEGFVDAMFLACDIMDPPFDDVPF